VVHAADVASEEGREMEKRENEEGLPGAEGTGVVFRSKLWG
jgi:hypothetical protein